MEVCGIVAEYDPFHLGHEYHLKQAKQISDAIVIVMSGNLTQRGELAKFSKWERAKAALLCGADLIIEIPSVFSCASAETFANSAMKILKELNCVTKISFGSESGEIEQIVETAKICQKIDKSQKLREILKRGCSHPVARKIAIGEKANILNFPNNSLGAEYVKACLNLNFNPKFHTVKRLGANHSSNCPNQTASSNYIRKNLNQLEKFVPKHVINLFKNPVNFPQELLFYSLRMKNLEHFKKLPNVTEGLENRLFIASKKATNLEEFFKLSKTKRYTFSRIKRIAMCSFLNFEKDKIQNLPQYGRVLGFNKTGQKILAIAKKNNNFLTTSNFKIIAKNFPYEAEMDAKATNLATIFQTTKLPCGLDYIKQPILI